MGRQVKYTYELLAEAAANSTSVPEVLRYLGVPTGGSLHSHIRRRMVALGVDTTHFTGGRKYSREVLAEAVANSTSVAGVLRYLRVSHVGGTHAHISRTIRRLELDTSHFQRYQGARKQVNKLTAAQILVHDPLATARQSPKRLRRALTEVGRSYACAGCACDGNWNGAPLTLHIDHINGDFRDNRAENLRYLCPNCHAQTPNFAGRSRGSVARRHRAVSDGDVAEERQ